MIYLYSIIGLLAVYVALVFIGVYFRKPLGKRTFEDGTVVDHADMPDWLRWLQNPEDGLTGDRRGWWWNIKAKKSSPFMKMVWWSGVRNPLNYWKRISTGCDVRLHTVKKLMGQDWVRDDFRSTGFQFLYAVPHKGFWIKPAIYYVHRWGNRNEALVIQLGWKLRLEHNDEVFTEEEQIDYYKGWTFEINPWKDIS